MDMFKDYALIKALGMLRFKELSIRELAKEADISPSTAKNCLDYLSGKRLVKKKILGRSHYYKLDMENFLARHLKILFSLNELNDSAIVKELLSKYDGIHSIVLYGSVARGEDDDKSDIDILVISRKEVKIKGLESEKKLKRELAIILYSMSQWKTKAKEDKIFYDRVIIDSIPLYGQIPMVI